MSKLDVDCIYIYKGKDDVFNRHSNRISIWGNKKNTIFPLVYITKPKGLSIEIDGHLQKYVDEENGITYYEDGSDAENPEIECSICGEYLISEDEFLTEGVLNAL